MDLLENVKSQYQAFKDRPRGEYGDRRGGGDRGGGYGGDRGGGYGGDRGGGYGDRNRSDSYGGGGGGGYSAYGGAQSPANLQAAAAMSSTAAGGAQDYSAQWAQYLQQASTAGQDPYAAYGGYDAFCRLYQQYYYSGQGTAQGDVAGTPMAAMQSSGYDQSQSAPPPPPPADDQPPPPPPPGADSNGYHGVPPPPGM